MTLYDQTKMTGLKHKLLYKEALPVQIGLRYSSPTVCWNPL